MIKVSLGGEVIDTQGELNRHVGMKGEYYGSRHVCCSFGNRNKKRETIPKFYTAMNLKLENTGFKEDESSLVTNEFGQSNKQVHYCLVNGDHSKIVTKKRSFAR